MPEIYKSVIELEQEIYNATEVIEVNATVAETRRRSYMCASPSKNGVVRILSQIVTVLSVDDSVAAYKDELLPVISWYQKLKEEIDNNATYYFSMSAEEAYNDLQNKTVLVPKSFIGWENIATTIGVQRQSEVEYTMKVALENAKNTASSSSASESERNAANVQVIMIDQLLNWLEKGKNIDIGRQETVDMFNQMGTQFGLTSGELSAIENIGTDLWTEVNDVVLLQSQVNNILIS